MIEVSGKYTSAIIHTDEIEDYAIAQIRQLCDHPAFEGSRIRIMPDVHPGKVGPIGFTATVADKILPAVVGIDIGCGIRTARIRQKKVEFGKLDAVIRENIPSGFGTRKSPHRFAEEYDFGGKTIIPFATSGISGIGESGKNIGELAKDAHVFNGKRFKANASADELKAWASEWL